MLSLGQRAEVTRAYSAADLQSFAALTGAEMGAKMGAELSHVPQPLIAALFSYLLGAKLPGSGTNYLKQDLIFRQPAPFDTPLTASVKITGLRPEKHLVDLWSSCRTPDGRVICEGRSLVKAQDVPGAF